MTTIVPADLTARELFDEIARWPIFDAHSHIDPHRPAARTLDEVLGYHYYTELAHSAGMPADNVAAELAPRVRARNLAEHLEKIDNTVQYSWLLEIARTFHDFPHDRITPQNVGDLYDRAERAARDGAAWDREVWTKTHLEAVFLTNDFDDPLEGWDTHRYVPCLRTDDLVLKLHEPTTVERLRRTSGVDVQDFASLRRAIGVLFERFVRRGRGPARSACPRTSPPGARRPSERSRRSAARCTRWTSGRMSTTRSAARSSGPSPSSAPSSGCPIDLMIGPIRNVYPAGVAGGRDLFDHRVSLHEYAELFNHFAGVTFPVSTLSPAAGAELVAYAWIFPNVLPLGHWWYSSIPAFIAADLKARLQAVPKGKVVGYYSDAYKLEFILPKFNMFRRVLSETLAEAVRDHGWTTDRALELARLVLLENPRRIFGQGGAES